MTILLLFSYSFVSIRLGFTGYSWEFIYIMFMSPYLHDHTCIIREHSSDAYFALRNGYGPLSVRQSNVALRLLCSVRDFTIWCKAYQLKTSWRPCLS